MWSIMFLFEMMVVFLSTTMYREITSLMYRKQIVAQLWAPIPKEERVVTIYPKRRGDSVVRHRSNSPICTIQYPKTGNCIPTIPNRLYPKGEVF